MAQSARKRILWKLQNGRKFDARDIFEGLAIMGSGTGKLQPKARRRLTPYVETAMKRLKLDGSKREHWVFATFLLAFAVYFRRPTGRTLVWTKKRVKALKADIDKLRVQHPNETETELCVRLLRQQPGKYRGKPDTLRRRLYRRRVKMKISKTRPAARGPDTW
jgi:hypothetical protein